MSAEGNWDRWRNGLSLHRHSSSHQQLAEQLHQLL